MITDDEFNHMQEILKPGQTTRPQKDPYDFILRGMLTCNECGHAIVTEKKYKKLSNGAIKEYRYCHCNNKNPKHKCKNKAIYIREDELLEQIKNELSKYTIDENFFQLAIEALIEDDEIEASRQNEKIARCNRQIAKKKNELDGLRRSVYTGIITDIVFFHTEQESLEKDIEALEKERDKVATAAKDWRSSATDIFMFTRYAKEDFDSDDWERKRAVIKRMGANLKLSGRTIVFTPVKYLIPIEKQCLKLKRQYSLGRTAPQQMKKDLEEDLISSWHTG